MQLNMAQLVTFPLFEGIRKEELPTMLKCMNCYTKNYEKNEMIFLESSNIKVIGVILSGTVHMIKEGINGDKALLVSMKQGDLLGESFACGEPCGAQVSFLAATNCIILFLPFYSVIHNCKMTCPFHHRLIENMVRSISHKNVQLMNKLDIISKKNLREKILAYLYAQAQDHQSHHFTIPFGRLELADYLCTDRSALTRELTHMKRDGLIDYEKNTFYILKETMEL